MIFIWSEAIGVEQKAQNRKVISITILVIILLLLTGALRTFNFVNPVLHALRSLLIFFIYIGMLVAWGVSIEQRVAHKRVRNYLLATVALMLFFIIVRTVKFIFLAGNGTWERLAWYSYYIPIMLIPLLVLWAALCIGNPGDYRPERKYRLLLIPTIILILGILTNEFHQTAFILYFDVNGYWEDQYRHNILYYAAVGWAMVLALAAIYQLYRKSRIPGTNKIIWLPLALLGIAVIYTILYNIDPFPPPGFSFIELTAMFCVITAGMWESFIQTGLIPVNTNYHRIFTHSSLAAQIIDTRGNVCYSSYSARPLDGAVLTQLQRDRHFQPDDDTLLHASPISGGYVIWQEDITDINALLQELDQTRQELRGRADLAQEEYLAWSKQISIKERIRIYDLLVSHTRSQLDSIKSLLPQIPGAEPQKQRQLLQQINFLGAYIKRHCNLSLMLEAGESITGETMKQTLNESLEGLRLGGITTALSVDASCTLNHVYALQCYDLFEAVVEKYLADLKSIAVSLTCSPGQARFTLRSKTAASPDTKSWRDWLLNQTEIPGRDLDIAQPEADFLVITLSLVEGGVEA